MRNHPTVLVIVFRTTLTTLNATFSSTNAQCHYNNSRLGDYLPATISHASFWLKT
jgi:hypothetical protein